jgi:hypothetical protein
VHVKPWLECTNAFKRNLRRKLAAATPGADPFAVAEGYRVRWFNSQHAWTKVPGYSDSVSACITMTYGNDFMDGLPMGIQKANKPIIKTV